MFTSKWYETAYRRAVIDMHIPDWDPKFLSAFDPDEYVARLVESRAQSVVAYCHSHVGLFYYPTKVGRQHAGLKGRNIVREVIDRCHAKGIAVVLYTSLIFDRWAADQHADWRMHGPDGKPMGLGGRHGLVCPNSPYRDYVRAFAAEIAQTFDCEGVRFDMTFWPGVCYCPHCAKRFAAEVGGELPRTVNWLDERWVAFQRRREAWLVEFARMATETVRAHRPGATVEHQASTFPLDWVFGVRSPLARQNDFLQGDFYGDALQGSFVRKLLEALTPNRPAGFETSFAVELRDHTTMKSEALLEAKASAAIADHTAFIFIDAIDPIGTVSPRVHTRMGRVFDRLLPYYAHLGGTRVRDVGVYYSTASKFSFAGNGRPVAAPDRTNAHTDAVLAVGRHLLGRHVPWGVVTRSGLDHLDDLRVLVLANVNMLDEDEANQIRAWVRAGGKLYASGGTSLVDSHGRKHPDFLLADVFGVSVQKADWQPREHYLAPTLAGRSFFPEYSTTYPAFVTSYGFEVEPKPGAVVLATTTLPWPAPDPSRFSSIHSNPPWTPTDRAELVRHRFGKGESIYCASLLETAAGLGETFVRLLDSLAGPYRLETQAPTCVEVTLFRQPERHRYIVSLVNFQKDLPNLPVEQVVIRFRTAETVRRVVRLPSAEVVPHSQQAGTLTCTVRGLQTLALLAVETG